MSRIITTFVSSIALVSMLSACGGGGGKGGSAWEDDEGDSPRSQDTAPNVEVPSTTYSLGSGEGDEFSQGEIITTLSNGSLSHGGTLEVSVNVVDNADNSLSNGSHQVRFTSNCVEDGSATIQSPIVTNNGVASTVYTAGDCEGTDTITATLSNGASATTSFDVASRLLDSLLFVEAIPRTIGLKGTGSEAIPDITQIIFSLRDNVGQPVEGKAVSFSLSTDVGGISLSTTSAVTNAQGQAEVWLSAGDVATTVNVTATVPDNGSGMPLVNTSPAISIVGSLPDQDSFTIGATVLNPRGYNYNGIESEIVVRLGDKNNNPAPDSTQVYFTTDGGSIVGSCTLINGSCTATWSSQQPRPADGLVNILAYTTGEESFVDTNSNGLYDLGEQVTTHLSEAYLDSNDNGAYDLNEPFADLDHDGIYTEKEDTNYQGANCSQAALDEGHCNNLVHVRNSMTICMSTDAVNITDDITGVFDVDFDNTVVITLTDGNGITPASGTKISVTGEDIEILAGGGNFEVPNSCSRTGYSFSVTVDEDDSISTASGLLIIEVTQVNGEKVSHIIDVRH